MKKKEWIQKINTVFLATSVLFCLGGCALRKEEATSAPESVLPSVSEDILVKEEPIKEIDESPHIQLDKEASSCDLSRMMSVVGRPIDCSYGEVLEQISAVKPGTEFDLRNYPLTFGELQDILALSEGQEITYHYNVPVGELVFSDAETEICFSEMDLTKVEDFDIEAFLQMMPNLEKIEMCNCGYTNEEMAALCDAHEDLRIIWEVHLEYWDFRTDIVSFTSDKTCADEFYMQNEDAKYLKYCTDLLALDLGHNYVNDFSFLENLTNLRVLIVVDNVLNKRPDGSVHHIEDLSVLNNLTEMRYLEIFCNAVTDISFLNNMPKLMDVNISYNPIYDASPLFNHPRLVRIWLEHTNISGGQIASLRAAYPNAIIVSEGEGSIDQGWRSNEHYYAMRRMFHNNEAEEIFMTE